ncbi:zinc finger protein, putative [Plasmodium chabaudi chabaudi]|uniref:Zinc finger protein, putative n=1 Tax=Plasmodium chabaudi chabaudi TaxID=31271 RepID=A0A1D3RRR0_PLACU|nr:zinc finger protein, putative [Plasmodium chabaudi chabaudi]
MKKEKLTINKMGGEFTDINEVGSENENIRCKNHHTKNINKNDDNKKERTDQIVLSLASCKFELINKKNKFSSDLNIKNDIEDNNFEIINKYQTVAQHGSENKHENNYENGNNVNSVNSVNNNIVMQHENEYTNASHLNNETPNIENSNLKNNTHIEHTHNETDNNYTENIKSDEHKNLNADLKCDNTEKYIPPLNSANNNEHQSSHTYNPTINDNQTERITNIQDINENSNTVLEPQNDPSNNIMEGENNLNDNNATSFNRREVNDNNNIENETPNNEVYTNETPYLRGEEEQIEVNSEMNVEEGEDNILHMNSENNVIEMNNIINERNSRSLASNSEEMNYYALTIRDNIINNNMNDNINENEVHELRFYQRCFIGKMLGYEIKPNLEEFSVNKFVRAFLFIFILLGLFSIEFSLLYNNLLKINVDDTELLLIDSRYNDIFTREFLFQFNKKKIKNLTLTNDMIKTEINKGNYKLYNDINRILNKLNKNNKSNEKKTDNIYEETIRMYEKLKKHNIFVYKIKEFKFKACRDIFKKIGSNNGKNYLFLFIPTQNHLQITPVFIALTLFFLFLRIGIILSRILYEFVLFCFYRTFRLSLNSKKGYLYKYLWSLCTLLFLEIILSEDCIIWWVSDIDPIFSYHFQYFIWCCTIIYFMAYFGHKIFKKWGITSVNNSDNSSNNNNIASIHNTNKYMYASYILDYVSKFLYGMNITFAMFFILINLGKPTVITVIITSAILFMDILNDSYLEQIHLTDFHNFTQNMQPKKKIYIIENKKRKQKKMSLTRVNEHTYREFTMDDILEYEEKHKSKKYLGSTQSNINNNGVNENDGKSGYNKKTNIFNFKNILNKKYMEGKWVYGRLSGGDSKCGEKSVTKRDDDNDAISNQSNGDEDSIISSFEYCEICDERPKNIVLYPCMHGGFCEFCIRSLVYNTTKVKYTLPSCPLCRKTIYDVYKISNEDKYKRVKSVNILSIKSKK